MNFLYERPKTFSNPDNDFSPEEINAIIAKKDDDLSDIDFLYIFEAPLTIGTYIECVYFLPIVIDRLKKDYEGDVVPDIYTRLLSWVNFFARELKRDDLYKEIEIFVSNQMVSLLEQYEIVEVEEKRYCPRGADTLFDIFDGLNRNACFDFLGDKILEEKIKKPLTYPSAAWFLTFLKRFWSDLSFYAKNELSIDFLREFQDNWTSKSLNYSQLLGVLSRDEKLKNSATDLVLHEAIYRKDDRLLLYWEKILASMKEAPPGRCELL